ncbi:uncharacterized protein LOC108347848 [Vigna angularis]|uniref:uncharacterized protein LOC108347848 n=1 Tax=Phaseolus angularis TaxID=3914 RepID=UPI000809FB47|nr:uncharacterized protein LOC108347848 [Vigna angularis]
MEQDFMEFKKRSVEKIDALKQKNGKLERKIEVEGVIDKSKEKEILDNNNSVHKTVYCVCTDNETKKEVVNTPLWMLLEQQRWVANQSKCEFGKQQIGYLGHLISERGVEMDKDKIKELLEWEEPKNLKALKGFLGLTGIVFLIDCIHMECDASRVGVGAVLMQNRKPIAFFGKALSEGSLSKSIYEKEFMALVMAIKHVRPYLLGRRFVVHTDQRSLKYLLEQRITTHSQQNWIAKLMGYDFDIVYKIGSSDKVADALSRKGEKGIEELELQAISRPYWHDFREVLKEVEEDESLKKIVDEIKRDPNCHASYTLENDRLHYKGRLVLSAKSIWIPKLLVEFHVTSTRGHSGHKYMVASPQALLQPLLIPQTVWEEMQGTQLKMSIAYHPETDGQTEVLNRIVEGYLRCFCSEQPKSWKMMLPWAEYWYNTSYQGAARCSPFEIVHGRAPPSLSRFVLGETAVETVAQDLMTRDEALRQLKFHLRRAHDLMANQANKRRREMDIKVGDWVYLKIRPHRQSSMPMRLQPKLAARCYGPFQKAVGKKRIEKELPAELQAEGPTYWPVRTLEKRQRQ